MRIVVANWNDLRNPHAGGAEIHLFELFRRLAARGHLVHLVCSGWHGCAPRETIDGIDVERHGDRWTFALLGRHAVREAVRTVKPDVVVEDINKLPLYLAEATDKPFCAIVPHLFGETAFQEAKWPVASVVWVAERPLPRGYRRAGWHAISESTRDDLLRRGVPRSRIRVIHPGVDSTRFAPDAATPRSSPPSFLYVGRLKRYKGVEYAVRALARSHAARPDLTLDIAGNGDYRVELERLVRELGLDGTVRFHGFVAEAEKLRLLRSTWANVFPSPKEGWGITVIEAAACGTPSIASDSPGLRDSVRDGRTGFLVPHGDVEALATRMLELAESPELVETLGRQARAHAETLNWDAAADATERHLADIIAGFPGE